MQKTKNYSVQCLGEIELDVYDIEVDDNHNFFANDILVHNSNFLYLNPIIEKYVPENKSTQEKVEFIDRFHKKYLAPVIENTTNQLQKDLNVYEPRLKFVRDVIADTGIFLAKKRYMLQVWDSEGVRYAVPEQKLMGIDAVKSSTPKFCREKIKGAIDIMFNHHNDELIEFIKKTEQEFKKLPVEQIAFPRGISDIDKYTVDTKIVDYFGEDDTEDTIEAKKGSGIHIKASVLHNKLIKEKNLESKIPLITNGDKIRYVYLKTPNPINNNAIAFDDKLPKEFQLDKYINYQLQYEKSFLEQIKAITSVIGWQTEHTGAFF